MRGLILWEDEWGGVGEGMDRFWVVNSWSLRSSMGKEKTHPLLRFLCQWPAALWQAHASGGWLAFWESSHCSLAFLLQEFCGWWIFVSMCRILCLRNEHWCCISSIHFTTSCAWQLCVGFWLSTLVILLRNVACGSFPVNSAEPCRTVETVGFLSGAVMIFQLPCVILVQEIWKEYSHTVTKSCWCSIFVCAQWCKAKPVRNSEVFKLTRNMTIKLESMDFFVGD